MADDQNAGSSDEQARFDDAGNLVEFDLKVGWVVDLRHVQVKDHMACLSLKDDPASLAQDRGSSRDSFDVTRGAAPSEGNDFDGQWKTAAQRRDQLRLIHHDDEASGRRGDDFFP